MNRLTVGLPLLFFAATLSQTAQAAPRDLATYPLKVTLLTEGVAGRHHRGAAGSGLGNVTDGAETRGMAYRLGCPSRLVAAGDEEYAARWTRRGQRLEIVLPDGAKAAHCSLTVALKNAVYVRDAGGVKPVAVKDYFAGKGGKAGKAARLTSLSAADSDLKRYPLKLDVMNVRWRDVVDGVQTGSGQGNMLTERGLAAVDFTISCPTKLEPLPDGQFYHARWRGEAGKEMMLFVDTPGSAPAVCELNTTVLPDVYMRVAAGTLQAVPMLEYQRMLRNDANVVSRF